MQKEYSGKASYHSKNKLQLIKILAVKATEENSKNLLKPMAVSSANISAIGAKSDAEFIDKRANYLFKLLPPSIKLFTTVDKFPGNWVKLTLLIAFIVGLLSNYLGPSNLIHVVYNPLTILIIWNIIVYLIMILKGVWMIPLPGKELVAKHLPKGEDFEHEGEKTRAKSPNSLGNRIISSIIKGLIQFRIRFIDGSKTVIVSKKILPAFWISYQAIAGKTLILRFKSLLSSSAIGLLIGALLGVYFRGLFYNYNVVWQSTFVFEPETIRLILNSIFGPASLILDGSWISREMVQTLLNPDGTLAGPWIHKMALTTLLFVFIPRTILALYFSNKSKRSTLNPDFKVPYYTEHILKNRGSLVKIIRDGIREIISKKIYRTGQTISDFVLTDYYEKFIAPLLVSFKEKGGKIKTLEQDLLASQKEFEPILLNYLEEIQDDFRDDVLTEISLFLGRKLDIDINTISTYQPKSDEIDQRLPGQIAADIGDTIGGTIVTTVALAVGSISGGIGKSLGIAIISGLIGVSGPLGLLIGGVITAVSLGGFYKIKRDKISGMIKDIPLPSVVTSVILTDAKIKKTRKETYAHTEKEIEKMLKPKIDEVTNYILKDITY